MTLHDQQQAAADVQGMIEAAQRHSGGMSQVEVAEQYRAIQARPIASPVIPQPIPAEAEPDPINFAPIVGAVAKLAAGIGISAIAWKTAAVGIATIFAFIEANTIYAVGAVVGGVALFGLSVARSSGSSSGNPTCSNRRSGGDTHNHYYQYNQQGQNCQQKNGQ